MEWLGRKLYPKARPYEQRSRMEVLYLMVGIVVLGIIAVAAVMWFLNKPPR